jgi:hypothetical protein
MKNLLFLVIVSFPCWILIAAADNLKIKRKQKNEYQTKISWSPRCREKQYILFNTQMRNGKKD